VIKIGTYQIGDIVDLEIITPLLGQRGTRMAIVVEIHKHFVVCKSIKAGYLECINYCYVQEGKKQNFPGYL